MKILKYPIQRVRMEQVQIRLPPEIRAKAKEIVAAHNTGSDKIHESDVYRTAITLFLSGDFTDSKDTGGFVIFLRHLKFILTGLVWFAVLMVTATGPDGLLVFVQMLPGVVLASLPLAWWLGKFIFSRLERRHE